MALSGKGGKLGGSVVDGSFFEENSFIKVFRIEAFPVIFVESLVVVADFVGAEEIGFLKVHRDNSLADELVKEVLERRSNLLIRLHVLYQKHS